MNKHISKVRKAVLDFQIKKEAQKEAKNTLQQKFRDGAISKNDYGDQLTVIEGSAGAPSDIMEVANEAKEEYRQELEQWSTLNPEDLTDDLRLFNSPIKLTPEDYTALEEKNGSNYSMLRAIKEHAAKNDVVYPSKKSVDKEQKLKALEEVNKVAVNIARTIHDDRGGNYMGAVWADENKFNDMYADVSQVIKTED